MLNFLPAQLVVMLLWTQRLIPAFGRYLPQDISTAVLPVQLIQEDQLSVNGKRMYAKDL